MTYKNLKEMRASISEIQLKELGNVRSRFEKNSPPIDITRKRGKFCNVSFNPTLDHDDVITLQNGYYKSERELSKL